MLRKVMKLDGIQDNMIFSFRREVKRFKTFYRLIKNRGTEKQKHSFSFGQDDDALIQIH